MVKGKKCIEREKAMEDEVKDQQLVSIILFIDIRTNTLFHLDKSRDFKYIDSKNNSQRCTVNSYLSKKKVCILTGFGSWYISEVRITSAG